MANMAERAVYHTLPDGSWTLASLDMQKSHLSSNLKAAFRVAHPEARIKHVCRFYKHETRHAILRIADWPCRLPVRSPRQLLTSPLIFELYKPVLPLLILPLLILPPLTLLPPLSLLQLPPPPLTLAACRLPLRYRKLTLKIPTRCRLPRPSEPKWRPFPPK
jgi:hypothetical protein